MLASGRNARNREKCPVLSNCVESVYCAGGPGGAATDDAGGARGIFKDVKARRDIIYLDQRGSNDRHRLTCPVPDFVIVDAPQQQVDDWMKQCLAGLDGDPRFLTTVPAMQDLDDARAALGYDKINLYGISYGATAIQVYMRMFPEHERTAVLDHGTALDLPFAQSLPRASQSALDQVLTYCEQDEACHTAYPDIRADWQAILDRLAKGPVVINYTPPGESEPAQVTMDMVAGSVHELLFKSGTYSRLPALIHMFATTEDWTELAMMSGPTSPSSSSGEMLLMLYTIFCFEPAWGYQPDEIARLNPGSYYRDLEVKIAQTQHKICTALPKPDPSLIYPAGKPASLSALMLNSLIDPQNPPSGMDLALKEFTRSKVVVEPTEGHDASASLCRWGIITQYIAQGSVDGLDTSCLDQQKPTFLTGNP